MYVCACLLPLPLSQAHYQAMANSLSATQQEVARHHLQIEQLNIQLAHEQKQVCDETCDQRMIFVHTTCTCTEESRGGGGGVIV